MKHIPFLLLFLVGCGTTVPRSENPLPSLPPTTGDEVATVDLPPLSDPPLEDMLPILMSPPDGGELLIPLAQGASAPFPGVLLNAEGVAWLEAEPGAVQDRAQLWVNQRISQIRLLSQAEVQRLQLRISTLDEVHRIEIQARDAQLESSYRINDQLRAGPVQWWEQGLWIGGALIVGLGAGIVIGLVAR